MAKDLNMFPIELFVDLSSGLESNAHYLRFAGFERWGNSSLSPGCLPRFGPQCGPRCDHRCLPWCQPQCGATKIQEATEWPPAASSAVPAASHRGHNKMDTLALRLAPAAIDSEDAQGHVQEGVQISFELGSFPCNLASSVFRSRRLPYSYSGVSWICDCWGST
jgi:hypothetical protein